VALVRIRWLVWVAVVEADWTHRLMLLVGREVMDDLVAGAANPDPVRWIDVGVPTDQHRPRPSEVVRLRTVLWRGLGILPRPGLSNARVKPVQRRCGVGCHGGTFLTSATETVECREVGETPFPRRRNLAT